MIEKARYVVEFFSDRPQLRNRSIPKIEIYQMSIMIVTLAYYVFWTVLNIAGPFTIGYMYSD